MSQSRWDDLYDRLTSRKLWMALLAIGFAIWNYHAGALTAAQFQTAVTAAVTVYIGAEGVTDFGASWGARREETRLAAETETRRAMEARMGIRQMDRQDAVERAVANG